MYKRIPKWTLFSAYVVYIFYEITPGQKNEFVKIRGILIREFLSIVVNIYLSF